MKASRLTLVTLCLLVVGIGIGAALPHVVARLSYAVEAGQAAAAREQLKHVRDLSKAFQEIVKATRPSVVNVSSVKRIQPSGHRSRTHPPDLEDSPFRDFFGDDFFDRFFQDRMPRRGYEMQGLGTGVIVSQDGSILTNNHVVRDADEVTVKLSDGRSFAAKVVGSDEKTDLAVVKIDASGLVPAELGNSDAIEVGEWVLAIGNPFGLDHTVTAGIISGKGRAGMGISDYEDFLQTDAAINPGNSGGPLVNLEGKVIGINTAIASQTGGSMGIGFAIPINMARSVMEKLVKTGKVQRGLLGAKIRDLDEDLAQSFGFEGTDGVLIDDVMPDGPAAKAGLKDGDIVLKIDGKPMHNAHQLRFSVASVAPGTKVKLEFFREGKRQTVTVELGELTAQVVQPKGQVPEATSDLGLTVRNLTPELAQQLGYDDQEGVVVTAVEPGSLAARAGIRPKDVIVSMGERSIKDASDFRAAVKEQDLKKGIRMQIKSEGTRRFVFLKSTR